jgi:MATE family multidrug resistance protein
MAANAIVLQFTHIAFMPALGIGTALCSQVGFAIGARRMDEVGMRTRVALTMTMIYMGAVGLLLFLGRRELMDALTDDSAVIAAGVWIMIWVALYQVFDAMSITYIFALRGAGDTRVPALLNGICCWGIFIGGGWLVAQGFPHFGLNGPWGAAVVYLTTLGFLLLWRFRSGAWKHMKVLREAAPQPQIASPAPAAEPAGVAAS